MSHNLADLAEAAAAALKAAALTYAEALIADTQTELNLADLATAARARALPEITRYSPPTDYTDLKAAVLDKARADDTRAAARAAAETLIAAARATAAALKAAARAAARRNAAGSYANLDALAAARATAEAAAKAKANFERSKANLTGDRP